MEDEREAPLDELDAMEEAEDETDLGDAALKTTGSKKDV